MKLHAKAGVILAMVAGSVTHSEAANLERGFRLFRTCASCHVIDSDRSTFEPSLKGIFGRKAGSAPDYLYSAAMRDAGEKGLVWDEKTLQEFLSTPSKKIPGTKMRFWGLWGFEMEDMIAFLKAQR